MVVQVHRAEHEPRGGRAEPQRDPRIPVPGPDEREDAHPRMQARPGVYTQAAADQPVVQGGRHIRIDDRGKGPLVAEERAACGKEQVTRIPQRIEPEEAHLEAPRPARQDERLCQEKIEEEDEEARIPQDRERADPGEVQVLEQRRRVAPEQGLVDGIENAVCPPAGR